MIVIGSIKQFNKLTARCGIAGHDEHHMASYQHGLRIDIKAKLAFY